MSSVLHLGPELGSCPVQAASFQEPPGTSLAPVQGRLLFRGPTYTNPPQTRKKEVCVIFAPPHFQLRLDHSPWLEHRRSRCRRVGKAQSRDPGVLPRISRCA